MNLKRWITAALGVALLAGVFGVADSSTPGVGLRLVREQLFFRTHKTANSTDPNAISDFGFKDAVDSMVTNRVGTEISVLDTIRGISTDGWVPVQNQTLNDTAGVYCTLFVYDATDTTANSQAGADSLYIATQVSADGATWATAGTFVGGTAPTIVNRLSQVNVAGGFRGCISMNAAANAKGAQVWYVTYKQRVVASAAQIEDTNLQAWPYVRWIVGFPDAAGYKVSAAVTHFTNVP